MPPSGGLRHRLNCGVPAGTRPGRRGNGGGGRAHGSRRTPTRAGHIHRNTTSAAPACRQARRSLAGGASHRTTGPHKIPRRPGRGGGGRPPGNVLDWNEETHPPARPPAAPNSSRSMPSTHLSLHAHLVFSTKGRARTIDPAWQSLLHAYLGRVVNEAGAVPVQVGGVSDHVHLLVRYRATHRISDIMRELKSVSSRWVHEKIRSRDFAWQEGYGAFAVCSPQVTSVSRYIARQEVHHRNQSFQDEYRDLLLRAQVEFDERYLW